VRRDDYVARRRERSARSGGERAGDEERSGVVHANDGGDTVIALARMPSRSVYAPHSVTERARARATRYPFSPPQDRGASGAPTRMDGGEGDEPDLGTGGNG